MYTICFCKVIYYLLLFIYYYTQARGTAMRGEEWSFIVCYLDPHRSSLLSDLDRVLESNSWPMLLSAAYIRRRHQQSIQTSSIQTSSLQLPEHVPFLMSNCSFLVEIFTIRCSYTLLLCHGTNKLGIAWLGGVPLTSYVGYTCQSITFCLQTNFEYFKLTYFL